MSEAREWILETWPWEEVAGTDDEDLLSPDLALLARPAPALARKPPKSPAALVWLPPSPSFHPPLRRPALQKGLGRGLGRADAETLAI